MSKPTMLRLHRTSSPEATSSAGSTSQIHKSRHRVVDSIKKIKILSPSILSPLAVDAFASFDFGSDNNDSTSIAFTIRLEQCMVHFLCTLWVPRGPKR